jgi:translation initiation factor IF-3
LSSHFRINNQIRAREVRLLGSAGENLGVVTLSEALAKAEAEGLDVIEISPNTAPPVAKIADYGKFQYEQSKKEKKAKASAKATETKSVQIKVVTGEHDLSLKAKKVSAVAQRRSQNQD